MTNSPPPNVKLRPDEPGRVLASGIDSLVLAIEAYWLSDGTFESLTELKERAKKAQADEPVVLRLNDGLSSWAFNVKPHGAGGYEWILVSREATMKIGNWRVLKQRPSVMIDIRAETLWTHGPQVVVTRVAFILRNLGATIVRIKPSRVDLACDILLPYEAWSMGLLENFVTRANHKAVYLQQKQLSGFTIGSGAMLVRIYDKALEIRKSKKVWMYDIWQIPEVPQGHRVIRVEFQMRRELLHSLEGDSWDQFKWNLPRIWSYNTQNWLRLVENATLHHTQQTLVPWWVLVMSQFDGMQAGTPLVRKKAIQQDILQLAAQTLGTLSSITTMITDDAAIEGDALLDAQSHTDFALRVARDIMQLRDADFTENVKRKHAKYARRPASASHQRKNRARLARALGYEEEHP